jgi:peptidoglycan/LPS O-acetylase OafA/YrhL
MGVFMAGSAVLRYRRRPGQRNRPETLLHLGVTALWLAALFVIPIVAEPSDQPRLGAFANAVSLILVFTAITGPPPRPGEAPALDARRLTTPRNGRRPGGMSARLGKWA